MNRPSLNHLKPLNRKNETGFAARSVNLIEAGKALIHEATFIGIVPSSVQREYTILASFSHANYSMVRDLLRKQKGQLVKEYDRLQRLGRLEDLKQKFFGRFAKLYRAKYLQNPPTDEQDS